MHWTSCDARRRLLRRDARWLLRGDGRRLLRGDGRRLFCLGEDFIDAKARIRTNVASRDARRRLLRRDLIWWLLL